MRTGLTVICIMVIAGLLVGMSLSSVMAQGEDTPGMTFHVIGYHLGTDGTENIDTIPADAPDVIVISGSYTNGAVADTFKLQAVIGNLCDTVATGTGTPTVAPTATATLVGSPLYDRPECAPVPIYYQVQLSISWDSNWTDGCGIFGYCSRALPPTINYQMGGSSNPSTESFACGTLAKAGSCSYSDTGIISAEDLRNTYFNYLGTGEYWNEKFKLTAYYEFGMGGNMTTNYTIMLSTLPFDTGCAGQYNIGATLGSFTLAATNSAGVNLKTVMGSSYPVPGQWYALHVTGAWKNNGTGADLRDIAERTGPILWFPVVESSNVGCSDATNDTYYLQMVSSGGIFFRVNDTDGNFASNTGSLTISVSAVTAYSPYPSGCELQYQVGDLIEQRTVAADQVNGWPLKVSTKYGTGGAGTDLQPIRYYMLETIGGPANLGMLGAEDLTWSADLGQREDQTSLVPGAWYESTAAPFVTCSRSIDQVGHVRVFFAADSQAELKGAITDYYYALRVRDTGSYVGNSGSLGYRLYEATNMQMTVPGETPGANGCASYSKGTPLVGSVVIQASNVFGMQLPALTSLSLYALEVTGGPWHEAGSTASYDVEISDDDGTTWTDIQDYPNLLCAASADGNHVIIYVYGAAGKTWKVRVNDTDSNFGTNTDSIGMDVYPGITAINQWPACESDYNLTKIVLDAEVRKIPGNIADGKAIPEGKVSHEGYGTYAVEITTDSKWFEAGAGTGSYLVDISDDGGTTWTALEDYNSLCTEQVGDGDRFRMVFTATSNTYKLRVRDGDSNYLNNTGYVVYDLYKAISNNYTPPGPGTTTPAPAEWVVACSERYSRPSSFIEWYPVVDFTQWGETFKSIRFPVPRAAEWIDYLRNAITFYFAWCPQHTDALKSVGAVALNKEPMKSIVDMVAFIKSIQALFDSYRAVGGAGDPALVSQEPDLFGDTSSIGQGVGGGSGPDAPVYHGGGAWDLFITSTLDPATNIWAGGKVDFTTAMNTEDPASSAAYMTLCVDKFTPLFGITTTSFCGLLTHVRNNGIIKWLVLVMDLIVAVCFLLSYFPSYLRRFIRVVGGRKAV